MIRVGSPEDHGISLDVIQIDGGTQSRASLNDQVVNEYAEAIKAGATFPPIVVFYDGKKHWLADGFHRFHAYAKAGHSHIPADVRQGTRRDAILHSVGANANHGLRRSNDDKRRAVLTLLMDQEWSAKPERWIATIANVSHTFVQKVRAAHLATLPDRPAEVEVQRGGTVYTQKVAKAAAQNAPKALDNDEPSPEAGPQAEASLAGTGTGTPADREGRIDGEAASVDLPTNSEPSILDQLLTLWQRASDDDRNAFVEHLRVSGVIAEPADAAVTAGNDLREPTAAASGQIIREGDAPRETGRFGGDASSPDTEFKSTAPTVEPEATPAPPPASGTYSNPQPSSSQAADRPAPTSSPVSAKAGDVPPPASPATNSKPDCLDPEHCSVPFTSALCARCNDARMKRRVE